jgi:hypothetical protein
MADTMIRFGPLQIEVAAYGSQGSAILGIRDSGKTYTATLMAERLFAAGVPFVAFDPVGVWRFLRVPGSGPGIPVVVAGGADGDLALSPATAPAIVEAAMQNGISLVIDLFSPDLSKADWRRIVRDSVRVLMHKNASHGLRHVFIEEAAEFAPQRVFDGEVYAAVEQLARMGGNARLGYTLINQRAEEVNKAVLELCDNLFLHRQKGRNSLTALSKWLDIGNVKDHRAIVETLATLPTGECWAWLAGTDTPVRVTVPQKNSLHPDRRILHRGDVATRPPVDAGAFVAMMRAALPPPSAELPKGRRRTLPVAADVEAIERARREGYERGLVDGRAEAINELRDRAAAPIKQMRAALATLAEVAIDARTRVETPPPEAPAKDWTGAGVTRIASLGRPIEPPRKAREPHPRIADGTLPGAAPRLLAVLAARAPARFTWSQAATFAGLKARGGHFEAGRKALRDQGLVTELDGTVVASPDGLARAGAVEPLPTTPDEILAMWCARLPSPAPDMLRALAANGPRTREDLAQRLGKKPRGGHWESGLHVLRTNNLISIGPKGLIWLSDELRG